MDIKPSGAESEWQKQVRSKTFTLDIDISFRVSDWGFGWRSDESARLPAIWPRCYLTFKSLWLVVFSAPRVFFPVSPVFSSPKKPAFDLESRLSK